MTASLGGPGSRANPEKYSAGTRFFAQPARDLAPPGQPQLVEDVQHVGFGGSLGQLQLFSDGTVGEAVGHQAGHLELPPCETPCAAMLRLRRLQLDRFGRAQPPSALPRPLGDGIEPPTSNISISRWL
jgi:hypothetical protein